MEQQAIILHGGASWRKTGKALFRNFGWTHLVFEAMATNSEPKTTVDLRAVESRLHQRVQNIENEVLTLQDKIKDGSFGVQM